MIERKFVAEKMKEFMVYTYLYKEMGAGKFSSFEIKRTPLGEKVVIYTTRPGLIVGKKGENIKNLTRVLKNKFKMENPQIEVAEIASPDLDAQNMAEQIVTVLERFGPKRFKSVGYKTLQRIIDAGAMGAEIVVSGRGLPGARAKSWRFYAGYLKKSGDVSMSIVRHGEATANIKSGSIGIKVSLLPPETILPDKITFKQQPDMTIKVEEVKPEVKEEQAEEKTEEPKKKRTKKKTEGEEKPKTEKKPRVKKTKDENQE